ncbi:MAG: diacylglycerol kinase family lipid kinase [Woeseia sp.]|nr:diacylglycerol kinase family lipid kinase [Woeseia sp.]
MAGQPLPLLYNPAAGRGSAARHITAVVTEFARAGVTVVTTPSGSAGDIEARFFELSEAGESRILLAGGDGSVHEAVNGLMRSSTSAALGVIPLGTGNDFAKANNIPLIVADAVAELAPRLTDNVDARAVDVGKLNDRFFANGAGIGFDAKISAIAGSIRLPIGALIYPLAVVRGLIDGVVTPDMSLRFNDQKLSAPLTLASFNIGQWVGGMFPIAPQARNDDGLLDVVYADALSTREVVRLVPQLLRGTHLDNAKVHHALAESCQVRASVDIPAHLDGENQAPQRNFDISILPGALRIL